jgi:plasmid stability protein
MATLYVENVPNDLYEALRRRARAHRKSIAAEVVSLLEQNIPTAAELKRRHKALEELKKIRFASPPGLGPFPTAEEMIREDRQR